MANAVNRHELARIIGERTMHADDIEALARQVAAYIVDERLQVNVESLVRDVMQYRLEHGIVEAVAVSAHELAPEVLDEIRQLLREHYPDAKRIVVNTHIDESLVGGVRIELPRENLDLSIRSKLNLFKRLVAEER